MPAPHRSVARWPARVNLGGGSVTACRGFRTRIACINRGLSVTRVVARLTPPPLASLPVSCCMAVRFSRFKFCSRCWVQSPSVFRQTRAAYATAHTPCPCRMDPSASQCSRVCLATAKMKYAHEWPAKLPRTPPEPPARAFRTRILSRKPVVARRVHGKGRCDYPWADSTRLRTYRCCCCLTGAALNMRPHAETRKDEPASLAAQ